jgi:hypothetical protein
MAESNSVSSAPSAALKENGSHRRAVILIDMQIGWFYLEGVTTNSFFTEKTFGTPFVRMLTRFLSPSLSTTPTKVTCPFFTIM